MGETELFINSIVCKPDKDGMYPICNGEYTAELVMKADSPTPAKPNIDNVIQGNGSCEVVIGKTNGVDFYQIQISSDYCNTWSILCETQDCSYRIEGLDNDKKYFIRVRARNDQKYGEYSHEYPVYPSAAKILPPEGLDVIIKEDELYFSWGKVLGAKSYNLYRKAANGKTEVIYSGAEARFICKRACHMEISSYAVSAVSLCGEGESGNYEINDDPAAFKNYKPLIDRNFNRNSLYCHHPFIFQSPHKFREVPSAYPDSIGEKV